MYEKLDKCPVCKNTQFDNYMICDDHSVTGESFALAKCRSCQLVFTNPRPEESNLSKYYQSDQYISHTDKANSLINLIYKLVRTYTLNQKVSLISKVNKGVGLVLDYGCGTGDFVKTASTKEWQVFGYEPDANARVLALTKNPDKILDALKDCPDQLGVITAWHVIEHVAELKPTLKSLIKKLKSGGHLIIAVPNHRSFDAQHYREYWAAYDLPRHLYHFDRDSMEQLAKKIKLKIVDIFPMKFDSYYVSILSEKYKKGNLLKAIKIAIQSNKSARSTGEYSSLIYILKK